MKMKTGKDTALTAFSMLEKCCILFDRIFCMWISEAIAVPWNSCGNQHFSAHPWWVSSSSKSYKALNY
jgi:hypothetical protein